MKKKFLFGIVTLVTVIAFTAITLNVTFSSKTSNLTDVVLSNVEALAMGESGSSSCTGPKINWITQNGEVLVCYCTNGVSCKDNYGCD